MPLTPFPTLMSDEPERFGWPALPFDWRHRPPPGIDVPQPCRIESVVGTPVDGEMTGFDALQRTLHFRTSRDGTIVELPFARFRRLTLTTPLQPALSASGAPAERVPAAAQERDYRLQGAGTVTPITGRTSGRVETADGMFLFPPVQEESALQRVFVPRSAYIRSEFGASAEEIAARMWISSPHELLAAIERQQRMPILPLGHSLLELGLLTETQLERALARQSAARDVPLGEMLVKDGLISRGDLQTALAHKMGYPLVDLGRFPIDPKAAAKLPRRVALGLHMVPLLLVKDQLIVAVDKPARVMKLKGVNAITGVTVTPVLASRMQIMLAQDRQKNDIWSGHVADKLPFFASTI
jgi:hypothetical protein